MKPLDRRLQKIDRACNDFAEFIKGRTEYNDADTKRLAKLGVTIHKQLVVLKNKCDDKGIVISQCWREVLLNLEVLRLCPSMEPYVDTSVNYTYSMINQIDSGLAESTMPDEMHKYLANEWQQMRDEGYKVS